MATEKQISALNRKGRPKGAKNNKTLLQEAIINDSEDIILKHFPKIVKAVVAQAEQGDLTAAKMIFDRVIPVRKAVEHKNVDSGQGITIVVQGIPQTENGRPVIEYKEQRDALEDKSTTGVEPVLTTEEEISNER